MKVLYTIYSRFGTPGGHVFSLEHLLSSLQGKIEIYVMCIGKKMSKVVEELPYKKFLVLPGLEEGKEINRIIRQIKPDVIHSFDAPSYILVSFYTLLGNYRYILTKPGGKSPHNGFPFCSSYICFSKETYEAFKSMKRYKNAETHLISNRVNKKLLRQDKQENSATFTFLQIVRLTIAKHEQIYQSLCFIKRLHEEGESVKFILAGTVNDKDEKNFVEDFIKDNGLQDVVTIITDSRVERGSDLLCMGDCIIGMGRSVMEAAVLGKVVVVPNSKSDYPLLLDNENFEELYKYNFSGRSKIIVGENEYSKIKRIISDVKFRREVSNYTATINREYFELTEEIVLRYVDTYKNIKKISAYRMLFKNFLVYIKFFAERCL